MTFINQSLEDGLCGHSSVYDIRNTIQLNFFLFNNGHSHSAFLQSYKLWRFVTENTMIVFLKAMRRKEIQQYGHWSCVDSAMTFLKENETWLPTYFLMVFLITEAEIFLFLLHSFLCIVTQNQQLKKTCIFQRMLSFPCTIWTMLCSLCKLG